jgi:hypothetical protein
VLAGELGGEKMSTVAEQDMEQEARFRKFNEEGVSLREANRFLKEHHGKEPHLVAELVTWLFQNWALQQVYQLDKTARQIFFDVLKSGQLVKPLMNQAGNPALVDWSAVAVEALHHLGGRAEIQDIYMEIARKRPEAAVLHWKASVRDALDSNSLNFKISGVSGVDAFNVDYLFYKDRENFWQLADFGI